MHEPGRGPDMARSHAARMHSGADTTVVRHWNRGAVLSALRDHPKITLSALARETGLSRPTATAVLEELVDRGLVVQHAPAVGGTGRPARRYSFRSAAGCALGLSIEPDRLLVVATDLDGTIVARGERETSPELPAPQRLELARDLAARSADEAGPVWAVGVASSGVIDREGHVRRSNQIPGWTGLALADTVGSWFGRPALAGNDGSLAALGEKWQGVARYSEDVALILTGHRIGQGILLGGELHIGQSGAAGELGKLLHDQEWNPTSVLDSTGLSAEEIFSAARDGAKRSLELSETIAERTARSASVLVSVLDPQLVVIAGDFTAGGPEFLDAVRRHLGTMCVSAPQVALSTLGNDAAPLGAARLALDDLEARQYLMES